MSLGMSVFVLPTTVMAQECKEVKLAANQVKLSQIKVDLQNGIFTLAMQFNLDKLNLPTNSQLIYTPILKTKSGLIKMPEIVVNGCRQQIMYERGAGKRNFSEDAMVVCRKKKQLQQINYQASVPMKSALVNYEVDIHEDLCGCGELQDGNDFNLLNHRLPKPAFVCPAVETVKVRHLDKRAYIDFPVNKTELHADYRRNPAQLDSIISTINTLKNDHNLEVSSINIHGYASPESSYAHNDFLAKNRAKTLTDYVRRMVKLPSNIFTVSSTAEDWEGVCSFVKTSNLEHKDEILALVKDSRLDPDVREQKIKTLYPSDYRFLLDNCYPALRHSDYHITYKVKPFDVEEAKRIIKVKPQQLSQEEMFMVAQTCAPESAEFSEVMEIAVRMFPNNEIANLNAANTRLSKGDADGAEKYLDKAGSSAEAQNARGMYELLKGNTVRAKQYFEQAAQAGIKVAQENLDNL